MAATKSTHGGRRQVRIAALLLFVVFTTPIGFVEAQLNLHDEFDVSTRVQIDVSGYLTGRGGRGVVEESLAEARVVSDSLDLANSAKKSREFDA